MITDNCDELHTEWVELTDRKSRIDELTAEIAEMDPFDERNYQPLDAAKAELSEIEPWTDEDVDRLAQLDYLDSQLGLAEAAHNGRFLVRDDQFEEYARDYANGISDLDVVEAYVDWSRFAADLATDYQLVTFEGVEYRVRS